jgi:hypothetical protein
MAQIRNPVSDFINDQVLIPGMDMWGYDGRRTGADDNDFYRDNADLMPGYNINGVPSGAIAQDRATNHVGHGTGPGNPWDNIRRGLVANESARMDQNYLNTGDAALGFGDVYDAHVEEYARSGGGGNQFIDPGSFALAVYAAPALEAMGIDAGPITGASIDAFNNPEDSAFEGWAKRMALGVGEVGFGAGLMGHGLMSGNPLEMAAGMGVGALGIGGMLWNTATAIGGQPVAEFMGDAATGALNTAGHVMDAVGNGIGSAIDFGSDVISGAGEGISDFAGGVADTVGSLFSW